MTEPAAVLMPGFVGTTLPAWLEARLRDGLGGVCLFGENIESPAQVRAMTDAIRAANPLALIAIDEEGGDVTRLHDRTGSPYPGNALLGRIDDHDLTALVGRTVARELRAVGVNLNFAPDADINSNPDNPVIGVRSFGTDAERVAAHVATWTAAHEREGVAVSAKHFPGHGDTAQDSHLALPVVNLPSGALHERELRPFVAASQAGARTIMTSHVLLPQLDADRPATFSPAILQGVLRGELGFDGVIVSDALDMVGASGEIGIPAAAVRAIGAGCDLLCIGTRNTDEQVGQIMAALGDAVSAGVLPAERLADAVARNRVLAEGLAAPTPLDAAEVPSFDLDRAIAAFDVADDVVLEPDAVILTLETAANIAVGDSPWGPAAAGAATTPVFAPDEIEVTGVSAVIVGKANHLHEWTRAAIDRAREQNPSVVVVDMGWPSPDRAYADIATFGASRYAGEALLRLMGRTR
ncbi:MAG TPA: glycoside hydrolase family 3 N-terminal domain-containing protein [Pseudolysinimonas sp.]|nr:glycoside hydrolase family 3 N-terminal domain-containing protein [Pseudolysinimonas sp.]